MSKPSYLMLAHGPFDAEQREVNVRAVGVMTRALLDTIERTDQSAGATLDALLSVYMALIDVYPPIAPVARTCLHNAARQLDAAADAGAQTTQLIHTIKTQGNGNGA